MSWVEIEIDKEQHPGRRMWVLQNDAGGELATIEHFAYGDADAAPFYLWTMNPEAPEEMVRQGAIGGTLESVKALAESRICG
jgi:hypothetical protein